MINNLGVFYQSGHKKEATFYSLERFRKYYPNNVIILYEDNGSNILKSVSDYFNCVYKRTNIIGENYEHYGKPVHNLPSALDWIDRIYHECVTNLQYCDWIMLYEDDVWVEKPIEGTPPYDLTGIPSYYINEDLKRYIGSTLHSNFGRGGSIFNRQSFIDSYDTWKQIDWDIITSIDKTPVEWCDCTITFYFDYAKKTVGGWSELINCNPPPHEVINQRHEWKTSPQEVDESTKYASIIHGYKGYYFPTQDEINYVKSKL